LIGEQHLVDAIFSFKDQNITTGTAGCMTALYGRHFF
jgi:hypothetical protein